MLVAIGGLAVAGGLLFVAVAWRRRRELFPSASDAHRGEAGLHDVEEIIDRARIESNRERGKTWY